MGLSKNQTDTFTNECVPLISYPSLTHLTVGKKCKQMHSAKKLEKTGYTVMTVMKINIKR